MSGELYLGLDVGTQSTKALLLDPDARTVVARAASAYELLPGLPPGAAEQHPDTWWSAVETCLATLARSADLARVRALGVSGQQHGFVALDAERRVLRPAKLWCDTSTAAEARELTRTLGRHVPTGFTASKILWLARHEPERFARLAHVLLPHDWINFRLTGELAMEAGDASGTALFDPATRRFDARACYAIDARLESCLPRLVAPDEPIGTLTPDAARALGLRTGIPVAPGGGDNMCAAIGAGATRAGIAVLSLGTSATVFAYARTPVLDPEGLIAPFCDSTGGYLPLLCVMNATGVLNEVARGFGQDLATLTRAAESVAPGSDGLLFLPDLAGERVPDLPEATGTLLGLRPGLLDAGHVFRAALEGVSLNLAWGVARLRALGLALDSVRLVGGGARNELWAGILADVLAVPVQRLAEDESAALGAALQAAAVARGIPVDELAQAHATPAGPPFAPRKGHAGVYGEASLRFRDAVDRLHAGRGRVET
ncbi:MAG TPA: xylulokinase [Planctomycetota bacterium]